MDILLYSGIFIISLAVLLFASERFIQQSELMGMSWGIPPFVIGVTIVAFGTSLPELATSLIAVFNDSSEIVTGNVVGSNITNILLVIGLSALLGNDMKLEFNIMDIDMPLLIGSSFLMFFVLRDLQFAPFETFLFLLGLVVFFIHSFRSEKIGKESRPTLHWRNYIFFVVAGFFVYMGAKYTILSIEKLAEGAGIEKHLIALTVIALGTSLPELMVSLLAAKKGKHGIAVGNILGSNIFNTYGVMGISSLFGTLVIPESILDFYLPYMVVVTIMFGMICLGGNIRRWEGGMLCILYLYFLYEVIKEGT